MKKLLVFVLILSYAFGAKAQSETFKPFKVDLALGYAIPGGSGTKGGLLFAIEPKYAINDQIALGLRVEGAVMARVIMDPTTGQEIEGGDVKASGSYLLTGDYYFTTNKFRPFAGLGAGIYSSAAASLDPNTEEIQSGTRFGFAPRVGFEFGHFRTALEYNVAGKTGNISNNYIGIKLGFFIGGGRRD